MIAPSRRHMQRDRVVVPLPLTVVTMSNQVETEHTGEVKATRPWRRPERPYD